MRDRIRPPGETFNGGEPGVVEPLGFVGDSNAIPYPDDVVRAVTATDIKAPTAFKPGSLEKQCLMYLRNLRSMPLHIDGDERDHTPTETRREVFAVPFGHGKSLMSDEGDEYELLD
jgi:hypothetical protein